LTVPSFASPTLASVPAMGLDRASGFGNKTDINVNVEGYLKVRDPFDIARTLGRFARAGVFDGANDK
jgi:hypothetical protein